MRPCAIAVVHGVGKAASIGAEPFVEPGDGVVVYVHRVGGEESAVFGVKDEDEPKEDSKESLINVVGIAGENVAQEFAFALVVGGLKTAQQFVERVENLSGELG